MDISYLLFLQNLRETTGGIFNKFFTYVTGYGEMACLFAVFAMVYWCINKKTGEYMLISLAFDRIINGILKITFCINRPWIRDARVVPLGDGLKTANGYSFPSGHTANATSCFGGFAMGTKCGKALKILAWVCALLVAFSRNYIGVHTLQDVVVSFLVAVAVLFGVQKLFDKYYDNPKFYMWFSGIGITACVLGIVYAGLKSYPKDYNELGKLIVNPEKMVIDFYKNVGYCLGIYLGWFIEKRFINFSCEGSINQKIFRFVLLYLVFQMVCLIVIPVCSKYMIKEVASVFKPFVQMMYICCIAPLIIKYAKL